MVRPGGGYRVSSWTWGEWPRLPHLALGAAPDGHLEPDGQLPVDQLPEPTGTKVTCPEQDIPGGRTAGECQ